MDKKSRILTFLYYMDRIQELTSKAEKLGWDEIHSYEDCTDEKADCGWAMQEIASHINWWFLNSGEYCKEWELLEENSNA